MIVLIFKEFMIYKEVKMENVFIKFKNQIRRVYLLANGYLVLTNWIQLNIYINLLKDTNFFIKTKYTTEK